MTPKGDSEKLNELAEILEKSQDRNQKLSAIQKLKELAGQEGVIEVLTDIALDNDEHAEIRNAARETLDKLQLTRWRVATTLPDQPVTEPVPISPRTNEPRKPFSRRASLILTAQAELSNEFTELLTELTQELNVDDRGDVIKLGLVLVGLASKAKQQGFRLAIVDDDGTLIANIDGI
jgi:hypothetical protein